MALANGQAKQLTAEYISREQTVQQKDVELDTRVGKSGPLG